MRHSAWGCRARGGFEPKRGGDGDRDEGGIRQRRKLDDPDPVTKVGQQAPRGFQGEARLADATNAGQGNDTVPGREVLDFLQFAITADQSGNRRGQVRQRRGEIGRRRRGLRTCLRRSTRQGRAHGAGELVAASGNGTDQIAIGPEDPAQCRDLGLQIILLDDPVRPDALHQRIFADSRPTSLDQCHKHVERAPAEFQRPIVGEHHATKRQDPEAPELDFRRRTDCGFHGY
ncbi:MAG TPA: hypothetical protein VK741_28885 [Acetobacteraceae bacterium]|nr:hypothetical protein [Acetobacteraceae bacterium]